MSKLVKVLLAAWALLFVGDIDAQKLSSFTLPTPWSESVLLSEVPLAEYPRPQMVRSDWMCLNGMWQYVGGKEAAPAKDAQEPVVFDYKAEKIRVPFPPESDLSGIQRKQETNMWYRSTISVPSKWRSQKVLLHFGAVDNEATVFVNGVKVGTHKGGYDAFALDITSALKNGKNELIVAAYDPNDGKAPSGKNGPRGDYTFTSGIWQTVWLEPVAKQHIVSLPLIPDVANRLLEVIVKSDDGMKVAAVASDAGKKVGDAKGNANERIFIPLKEMKLWSPNQPFLYDLKVQLKTKSGRVVDEVKSYFGMRSCTMGKVDGVLRPLLNGRFLFQLGTLDQGYWPDGIFTAPTDEALAYDINLAKRAGFNTIRKHIKVEPQRWYYLCDKIGMMVWQDMPNIWEPDGEDADTVRSEFRRQLATMIEQHISSPSIVTWVPFNENWGAFDVKEIADEVKALDPSRWVNGMSGYNYAPGYRPAYGDPGNSDYVDIHTYGRIHQDDMAKPTDTRMASLGEFGGKGLFMRGNMWPCRNDAYDMKTSVRELTDTYVYLLTEVEQMKKYFGLSAAIYTQTTDVEHEVNGFVTYDRKKEKMELDRVREINQAVTYQPEIKKPEDDAKKKK